MPKLFIAMQAVAKNRLRDVPMDEEATIIYQGCIGFCPLFCSEEDAYRILGPEATLISVTTKEDELIEDQMAVREN